MQNAASLDGRPAARCAGRAVSATTTRRRLTEAWARFHAGFQAEGYTITIRDPAAPNDRNTFNLSKSAGLPDPIPHDQVLDEILTNVRGSLCRGWSPIARPRPSDRTIFQLDDLSAEDIEAMHAEGWRPCYTQETSPGHYQAALATGPLADKLRLKVRKALITRFAADSGATGAFRIPGFRNCKPEHCGPDGLYPRVRPLSWPGQLCPRTAEFVALTAAEIADEPEQGSPSVPTAKPDKPATLDALAGAWHRLQHHAIRACGPEWKSEHDWMMAVMLRYAGATVDEVEVALETLTPRHDGRGKGNQAGYEQASVITAARAFGAAGDKTLARLAGLHWQWDRDLGDPE